MEKEILKSVKKAMSSAIVGELVGYNKPLSKLTEKVVSDNQDELYGLINDEFVGLIKDPEFKEDLGKALRSKLAKSLISRMGGELERRVNEMKADPSTRARITLAIDDCLK